VCPPAPRPRAGGLNPDAGLLPAGFGIRLDAGTRCSADGRTLLGGSPLRLLRLSEHAANLLAGLRAGAPAVTPPERRLGRRLCDFGLAHPAPPPGGPGPAEVTCVVPVRDDPAGLAALLRSLETHRPAPAGVIVAEDGSRYPNVIADLAGRGGARLIQRRFARGPAAARNEAWRATDSPIVAFLDSDVTVAPDWLIPLLAHFTDPAVAAVAPRVRARGGEVGTLDRSTLDRFERHCSPLDMGALASIVGPHRRVRYVPSAALLFRREALEALGGFDEDLWAGEDVDLIWRAVTAGWTVRYVPSVSVGHRNRPTWAALGRQRFGYGASAAALAARHPAAMAPLEIAAWSVAAWATLVLRGRKGFSPAAMIVSAALGRLHRTLAQGGWETPAYTARLVLAAQLAAGQRSAAALRRTWLPLLLAAAVWPSGRRLASAALLIEPLAAWATRRPGLGPVRWTAAALFADAAYCAGVWRGAFAARSAAVLRPRLTRATGSPNEARAGAPVLGSRPTPG